MKRLRLAVLLLAVPALVLSIGTAWAAPATCTVGERERTVEVVYSDPGQPVPCEVLYAKSDEGTIETLWRANNEAGYCEAQAAAFLERLESLGWDCATTSTDADES